MATIIRAPRLNKKPRKLHGVETVETGIEPAPVPDVVMESREPPEHYTAPENPAAAAPAVAEPAVTQEEWYELSGRLELAETRAEAAGRELTVMRSELETLKAKAREEGYAAGCEEANARLDAEYRQKLESVREVLQSLSGQLEQMTSHAEDSIVETVYAAVVKIIGDRLVDADSIVAVVRHVSAQLVRPEKFTVRLATADYELIAAAREPLAASGDAGAAMKIVADPRIELGGCILESATGSLDARLEVQLERLKDVLLDSRARKQSELTGKK